MDQTKLRKCGKAKCGTPCEDENRGKPKTHYGLASVWRQKECLTCLVKVSFLADRVFPVFTVVIPL